MKRIKPLLPTVIVCALLWLLDFALPNLYRIFDFLGKWSFLRFLLFFAITIPVFSVSLKVIFSWLEGKNLPLSRYLSAVTVLMLSIQSANILIDNFNYIDSLFGFINMQLFLMIVKKVVDILVVYYFVSIMRKLSTDNPNILIETCPTYQIVTILSCLFMSSTLLRCFWQFVGSFVGKLIYSLEPALFLITLVTEIIILAALLKLIFSKFIYAQAKLSTFLPISVGFILSSRLIVFFVKNAFALLTFINIPAFFPISIIQKAVEFFLIYYLISVMRESLVSKINKILESQITEKPKAFWAIFKQFLCDFYSRKNIGKNKFRSIVTIILIFVILIGFVYFIATGLINLDEILASSNSSSPDVENDKCYRCNGSGLINEGFLDFKTCPACKGTGIPPL